MHTSNELIELYLQWCKAGNVAAGSMALKRNYLTRFAAVYDLNTCTTQDIAAWLSDNPKWKPATRRSARSALTTYFGWAQRNGHRTDDPAAETMAIRVPMPPPKPCPESTLTDALAKAEGRVKVMLLLGAFAGLRRAEIAGLHADHIDLETGRLTITGKGNKTRLVPCHPSLLPYLHMIKARGGYAFPSPQGGHITPTTVGRLVKPYLGSLSTHSLRHRFASQVHANSHDLRAVQDLLGHSSLATTQRYLQITDEQKSAAVMSLGGVA
jgi:site-specific recombinase XerD